LRGEIVATQDPVLNRPLMLVRFKSILDEVGDLKPINKLEINTEGLQLLTNSPLLVRRDDYPLIYSGLPFLGEFDGEQC
jgi:16S rRNA U516 pseudouridylate synthase RsuA-like enzyme